MLTKRYTARSIILITHLALVATVVHGNHNGNYYDHDGGVFGVRSSSSSSSPPTLFGVSTTTTRSVRGGGADATLLARSDDTPSYQHDQRYSYNGHSLYGPYHHQVQLQQQQQHHHHQSNTYEPTPEEGIQINLKDVSLALRWTGELNRQLHEGSTLVATSGDPVDEQERSLIACGYRPRANSFSVRGGAEEMDSMYYGTGTASTTTGYRIREADHHGTSGAGESSNSDGIGQLTIFHAKSPRLQRTRDGLVRRWGPDLHKYLQHLVDVLDISSSPSTDDADDENDISASVVDNINEEEQDEEEALILALTMIYLDRACSVETPRSMGGMPCPFITPRTVHRLLLTSLVIAVQTVRGETLESISSKLASLGIPNSTLYQMVSLMRNALGDPGTFVTPDQMYEWKQTWEATFPSSSSTSSSSLTSTVAETPLLQQPLNQNNEPAVPNRASQPHVHHQHSWSLHRGASTTPPPPPPKPAQQHDEEEEDDRDQFNYYARQQQYYNNTHATHAIGIRV